MLCFTVTILYGRRYCQLLSVKSPQNNFSEQTDRTQPHKHDTQAYRRTQMACKGDVIGYGAMVAQGHTMGLQLNTRAYKDMLLGYEVI